MGSIAGAERVADGAGDAVRPPVVAVGASLAVGECRAVGAPVGGAEPVTVPATGGCPAKVCHVQMTG